jgi:hypothetical protein
MVGQQRVPAMSRTAGLLAGHGDLEVVLGWDEVAVVVVAEVELDPLDGAGERVAAGWVVVGDRRAGVGAHVGGLVASMRPDSGIVRELVWQLIRELGAPVFAFGKPWFGLLEDRPRGT